MSGSGGGGGGGGGPDTTDCSTLMLRTHLNSPKPAVLKTLKKDDVLAVDLQSHGGKRVVVAKTSRDQVAGSITGTGLASLIECLQKGYSFEAVVASLDGGGCVVVVKPAQ